MSAKLLIDANLSWRLVDLLKNDFPQILHVANTDLGQIVQERAITAYHQTIDMGIAAEGIYTLAIKGLSGSVRFTVMR